MRGGGVSGFRVAEASSGAAAGVGAVGLPGLLAAQEAGQEAGWDREARRHGEAVLEGLAEVQLDLLRGGGAGALEALAALVRRGPVAADPRLAAVQRALLVRAAVELARGKAGG